MLLCTYNYHYLDQELLRHHLPYTHISLVLERTPREGYCIRSSNHLLFCLFRKYMRYSPQIIILCILACIGRVIPYSIQHHLLCIHSQRYYPCKSSLQGNDNLFLLSRTNMLPIQCMHKHPLQELLKLHLPYKYIPLELERTPIVR